MRGRQVEQEVGVLKVDEFKDPGSTIRSSEQNRWRGEIRWGGRMEMLMGVRDLQCLVWRQNGEELQVTEMKRFRVHPEGPKWTRLVRSPPEGQVERQRVRGLDMS